MRLSTRTACVLTNSPAPYRDQLYREIAPHFKRFVVYYIDSADRDRSWRSEPGCEAVRLVQPAKWWSMLLYVPRIVHLATSADVLYVGGYDRFGYMLAMAVGRLVRCRVVLIFDGIAPSRFERRGWRVSTKRWVVRMAHVALVNGTVGHRYFADVLGFPSARLRNQVLVPVCQLDSTADGPAPDPGDPSLDSDVLFVGRLIQRKGVKTLLKALQQMPNLRLVVVGDGPERVDLEDLAQGLDVQFVGEVDWRNVPAFMKRSRCLVVPSFDEPWGLVVQEGLQANVSVVASDDVGSAPDLIKVGRNGYIFAAGDVQSLASALEAALSLPGPTRAHTNSVVLQRWSLENHAQAFLNACGPRSSGDDFERAAAVQDS